jgi:hypothetical protein
LCRLLRPLLSIFATLPFSEVKVSLSAHANLRKIQSYINGGGKMKKKEVTSQGEFTWNPNDKDPFRRKQQKTISESRIPRDRASVTIPQLKARLDFAENAYSLYGIKRKEVYKGREMPRICVEMAKRLKGRKDTQ